MKTTFEAARRIKKGYALVVTLLFLLVTTITLTSLWLWTANNASTTQRNINFNQSAAAAEAATEKIFTQMDRDFLYGNLSSDSNTYTGLIPDTSDSTLWPIQYTFSDTNGNANKTYVSINPTPISEPLNSQYAGLIGLAQDCVIISVATPVGQHYNVPATVSQTFQAAKIPVFQFAIFYNLNLEMDPGQLQSVSGPVFCNANIWEGNANLTFDSTVQAVGTNYTWELDPFSKNYPASGDSTAAYTGTPLANFGLGAPSDHNNALTMPIGTSTNSNPTNVEAIINLPATALGAPNPAAYAPSNQVYLFNESDLIISNAPWGTNGVAFNGNNGAVVNTHTSNITIWFQNQFLQAPLSTSPLKQLTNDMEILKLTSGTYSNLATGKIQGNVTNYDATNILYAGFSFVTNVAFTDHRESDTVQAVQIDIANFRRWLTNNLPGTNTPIFVNGHLNKGDEGPKWNNSAGSEGHGIWSIYVYNSVPTTSQQLPAVRLIHGGMMPTNGPGLTVSTPFPLYIYGDYNISNALSTANNLGQNSTTHTYPASVLADAVTILSDNWNDTNTATGSSMPTAANTTINAAMLEGIVQTSTNISGDYSGGVENFMRLLEDWTSGPVLTYNGSIVVMFPSIYATNHWQPTGNYYNAPTRHWAFDLNFENANGLPPLTPSSRALIRNNWKAY
jgi:hypothetical protein